ncbi:hypothetical protein OG453_07035 [Streptomyces sp. NBC_01381]|uniref:hypothetical protein n=1 Tax=Streptomyces sp. NBC_01381 TaxID=2903845 RepID=UPI00224D2967|nr:hypothetical protein [Streptomyces sp. NBC_01381]MCX4666422.1 hypothetical protein [Streptomyces sp. NBC_01381]
MLRDGLARQQATAAASRRREALLRILAAPARRASARCAVTRHSPHSASPIRLCPATPLLVPHTPARVTNFGNGGASSAAATGLPFTQIRPAHTPSNKLDSGRTRSWQRNANGQIAQASSNGVHASARRRGWRTRSSSGT